MDVVLAAMKTGTISCTRWMVLIAVTLAAAVAGAVEQDGGGDEQRYIFAWPFIDTVGMAPRGGTTEGPEVTADTEPGAAWRRLREDGLDNKERDRRAILAMAGPYRASFDFLETVGFSAGFEPRGARSSGGTRASAWRSRPTVTMLSLAESTTEDDFDADAARAMIDAVRNCYVDGAGTVHDAD